MLPKRERLDRTAFNRSFSAGKRFHSPSLMLIFERGETLRASAVAPKKVARTAVRRNKFRRRIYDALYRMQREQSFAGTFICVAKEGASKLSYETLKEELHALVRKTGVLR